MPFFSALTLCIFGCRFLHFYFTKHKDYINPEMLEWNQNKGLLLLITAGLRFPRKGSSLDIEITPDVKKELENFGNKVFDDLPDFISKVKQLKDEVVNFSLKLLHPNWSIMHLIVNVANLEIEKEIKDIYGGFGGIKPIFVGDDLNVIPPGSGSGVKHGKLNIKLPETI